MDARLDSLFQAAVDSKKVPGAAAIALDASGKVLYKGAFGSTNTDDPTAPPFTTSTTVILWSCTKLVTSVAALQLLEQGKLSLDDPVEKYCPEIKEIQVLDGFEADGQPKFRAPKTKPTILNLMTHTGGFSYDFFDHPTLQWRLAMKQEPGQYIGLGSKEVFYQPFIFDPGTKYTYGVNTDWLGFVVEAISGLSLPEYVDVNILKPLGLVNSGPRLKPGDAWLKVHIKGEDGKLVAAPVIEAAKEPWRFGGGHYMYSTIEDYTEFLLALLNNGTHPKSGARILDETTVKEYLFQDQMPKICSNEDIGVIPTAIPAASGEGEFLPGVNKGWSCGLMMSLDDAPKGRSAGSGAWAGLGNNFFWVDPKSGKLGMIVSAILPFMDKEVLHLFDALEREVYGHEPAKTQGETGSNFSAK